MTGNYDFDFYPGDPCQQQVIVDQRCFTLGGQSCTEDQVPRVDWSGLVEADQLAGQTQNFSSNGVTISLSTPTSVNVGSIAYDAADEAIRNEILQGGELVQTYTFDTPSCVILSTRIWNSAALNIVSDGNLVVTHNTDDPAAQGLPPVVLTNGTTDVTAMSNAQSRIIVTAQGVTTLTLRMQNLRVGPLMFFSGLSVGPAGGAITRIRSVTYSDGTGLIFNRDDPTTTYAAIDPAWSEVDCGIELVTPSSSELSDIEYLIGCADGQPIFAKVMRSGGIDSLLGYVGPDALPYVPVGVWTPGSCTDVATDVSWVVSEIVAANNAVVVGGTVGINAVLVVDRPDQLDYTTDYGEIDGIRVWPSYSFGNEVIASTETLASFKTLQAFGKARWVVMSGSK